AAGQYRAFAAPLGFDEVVCVPVSALEGSNVVTRSSLIPWYEGPSLLGWLETVKVDDRRESAPFRMVVQWVNRASPDFRGLSGRILSGTLHLGDRVTVLPGAQE